MTDKDLSKLTLCIEKELERLNPTSKEEADIIIEKEIDKYIKNNPDFGKKVIYRQGENA